MERNSKVQAIIQQDVCIYLRELRRGGLRGFCVEKQREERKRGGYVRSLYQDRRQLWNELWEHKPVVLWRTEINDETRPNIAVLFTRGATSDALMILSFLTSIEDGSLWFMYRKDNAKEGPTTPDLSLIFQPAYWDWGGSEWEGFGRLRRSGRVRQLAIGREQQSGRSSYFDGQKSIWAIGLRRKDLQPQRRIEHSFNIRTWMKPIVLKHACSLPITNPFDPTERPIYSTWIGK